MRYLKLTAMFYNLFLGCLLSLSLVSNSLCMDDIPSDDEEPPIFLEIKRLREAFDDGVLSSTVKARLDQIDFRSDQIPEIDADRLDGAIWYIRFNEPENARELLTWNLESNFPNILFQYRIHSLIFAHVFKCADDNWIRRHLIHLNTQINIYNIEETHFEYIIGLIALNCRYNTIEETRRLWEIVRMLLIIPYSLSEVHSQANEMWLRYEQKYQRLNLERVVSDTNPFLLKDPYGFCAYWEVLNQAMLYSDLHKLGKAPQGLELDAD